MIGQSFSHYRIVEKLGEGGMGEVFLAEDTQLDRKVAIKFLPSQIAQDARALARFDREAKAAAAISHPNIITVHEVGVCDNRPYITMAYVEGTSLTDLIHSKRLSVGRAVDIATQVCDGLAEAHKNGVVHRDIKPGNIHVDSHGRVRILDFGLALRPNLEKITREDMAVGTISYMSPEQATGGDVDARSDLFSLGTVLYEMFAGKLPFDGPHPAAVVHSIVLETPRPIHEVNPSVSAPLAQVLARALEKDPAKRFASAKEFQSALRAAGGAAARVERSRRRRHRGIVVASALAALAAALVFGLPKFLHRDRAVAQSLAVLPMANMSGDPQQDFFVDGMTDAIITRLAQIKALKVISRTSVMQYRDTRKPLKEIARELNVKMIVEGAVMRSPDGIRITAQLIDASTDNHIWADAYGASDASSIIELQSRVAIEIAQQVSVHVTPDERMRLGAVAPAHPEAYESYLQGRFYFNRRTPPDIAKAVDYFTRAIDLDSTYAPAFAGIADCYTVRAMWNWDTSQNTFPQARYACERALRIDPLLAEAHASLAMVQLFYDWDWTAAEKSFKRSIELNPNYATAYHWYGLSLLSLGRYDDAVRRMKQATDLDPFAPIMLVTLSQGYDLGGHYDRASEAANKALEIFPAFGYAWLAKSWIAFHQKDYQNAVDWSRKAMKLKVDRAEAMLVAGLDGLGQRAAADSVLADALVRERMSYHVLAVLYGYHGDMDHALEMTEKAIENREWFIVAFRSRWLEPLHKDPRFDELLKTRAPIKGVD